jgi:hypothetical protein
MQEVPPADEDETGLCEKYVARGGNATVAGSAAVNTTVSPDLGSQDMLECEDRSYKLITIPEVQDMVAIARATVLSWVRDFLGGGGERGGGWEKVFELDAALPEVGKGDDEDGGDGADAMSYKTLEMDMPPMPQSPFESHPTYEEKRVLRTPPPAPKHHSTRYNKHILDKLRYLEDLVEPASPQYEGKTWSREPTTGREICVALDDWYVVAACLQISVEELHEMMTRLLEKRAAGGEEEYDED